MSSELHDRPILIVYGEIDLFVLELQDALDQAGADTMIARTPADTLSLLQRLDFDAIVLNLEVYSRSRAPSPQLAPPVNATSNKP